MGKVIGLIVGTMIFQLPLGPIIGLFLGHLFDQGRFDAYMPGMRQARARQGDEARLLFFDCTFSIMGYIAKADGVVSEKEIQTAESIMLQMQLTGERRQRAIKEFYRGKSAGFECDAVLAALKQRYWFQPGLLKTFLEFQLQVAMSDGPMTSASREALRRVFSGLGMPASVFEQFERQSRAGYNYSHYQHQQYNGGQQSRAHLQDAYTILEVEKTATDAEVKKAYRRMMSKHHPDRLMSKGVPAEMIQLATQKTQQIKEAYEEIKRSRGIT